MWPQEPDCDPLLTEEVRSAGPPERHAYGGISPRKHRSQPSTATPGWITSRSRSTAGASSWRPGAGETRTLDVQRAVSARTSSTFTLTALGRPGGRAVVMISE